mmetsp:Transcript_26046/g.36733  ORF Transcript_26046/g.36733 Transcript_26046/m.36733 type:complete len:515 (+) Transcript_26046:2687-4231(+)
MMKNDPMKCCLPFDKFATALRSLSYQCPLTKPNTCTKTLFDKPDNVIDFLKKKCGSTTRKMPRAVLRKTVLKMIQAMEIFSSNKESASLSQDDIDKISKVESPPEDALLESALHLEWQSQEVKLLQALLKGMEEWGKRCDKESRKLDEYLKSASHKQHKLIHAQSSRKKKIEEHIADHEKSIRSLQDTIETEQRHLDNIQDLKEEGQIELDTKTLKASILQSLSLGSMLPFSVHNLDDDHIEIQFSHVALGFQIYVAIDLSVKNTATDIQEDTIRGYLTFNSQECDDNKRNEPANVIPREHVANRFYQSLLLCGGDIPPFGGGNLAPSDSSSIPISPYIMEAIQSCADGGDDLQETIMTMSEILGRMDVAALEFQKIADSGLSLLIKNDNRNCQQQHQQQELVVGTSIEIISHEDDDDGNDSIVVLVIPLSSTIIVRFSYDRQIHECVVYCTPTSVEVVDISNDGKIVNNLQAVADRTLTYTTTVSSPLSSVVDVDNSLILQATCQAIHNEMDK